MREGKIFFDGEEVATATDVRFVSTPNAVFQRTFDVIDERRLTIDFVIGFDDRRLQRQLRRLETRVTRVERRIRKVRNGSHKRWMREGRELAKRDYHPLTTILSSGKVLKPRTEVEAGKG